VPGPPAPDPYPQYVTDADLANPASGPSVALRAAFVPKWKPNTAYASGEIVLNPSGQTVSASSAFTSGATYGATNWTVVSGLTASQVVADPTVQATLGTPSLRPRRLQGHRISRMLTTFATGHGWTGVGGTFNLNDTSDGALSSQSVSVQTSGNGNTGGQRADLTSPDLTAAPLDLSQYDLLVWYKITSGAPLFALTALAYTDATNAYGATFWQQASAGAAVAAEPYQTFQNLYSSVEAATEWRTALFDLSTSFNQGTPGAKSAITKLALRAIDFGGGPKASLRWGGVALVPKASASLYPNGVITIGLDDGYISQFTDARPALDKYGFPAVAYVIQDLLPATYGGGLYLGVDQLHRLEDVHGWEVAAHSAYMADHNQTNAFGALSESALRANLEKHKRWMISEGFRGVDHFAYPQGKYTTETVRIVRDYFTTARTVLFGNLENAVRPGDPLRMRCIPVDASNTLATLQSRVDAIKANRSWGQLYLHQIAAGATGTSTTPTIFSGLIDYIAAQGVAVRTVSDVLAGR
jgi:peptidoglycan/xylan/chitin deacetylase (PgdA/CDA1 family)